MQPLHRPVFPRTFGSGSNSQINGPPALPLSPVNGEPGPSLRSGTPLSAVPSFGQYHQHSQLNGTPVSMPSSSTAGAGNVNSAGAAAAPNSAPMRQTTTMNVKRVTLTSKKNWWMVEMDEEEQQQPTVQPHPHPHHVHSTHSSDDTVVEPMPLSSFKGGYNHGVDELSHTASLDGRGRPPSPPPSPIYNPPRHPTSIFSFPTPTAYAAPPNSTASLTPFAHGSASELFRCVVKKPDVIQLEINGEMQSNASDVTVQFLAELRVYTTLARHRNICAFLGCLENVGMVLAYIDGRTLYDVICERPPLTLAQKIDYHNQLLDGLTHLHSYRLSHGDLSLLNVQVTKRTNTVKLLDFGRSVSADSSFKPPDEEPVDPFPYLHRKDPAAAPLSNVKVEQIHPGTRPFSAPEILRGECTDPLLADAYSFGMVVLCIDKCESLDVKPWEQKKDRLPKDFFDGCDLFGDRVRCYLRKVNDGRRRLVKEDMVTDEGDCYRFSDEAMVI